MLGLLISLTLALLVVVTAITALRRGELELGERTLRRPEPMFWIVIGTGAGLSVLIAVVSLRAFFEVHAADGGPPELLARAGAQIAVPATWRPMPELEALMGEGSDHVVAVAGEGAELLVLWPPTRPLPDGGAVDVEAAADAMKSPAFGYERWDVRSFEDHVVIDATYPSPRGRVAARHLLFDDGGALRVVTATCSSEVSFSVCEGVVQSLTRAR